MLYINTEITNNYFEREIDRLLFNRRPFLEFKKDFQKLILLQHL